MVGAATLPQERSRRAVLVVPATHPERIAKAIASGADEVVVDLEDAVPAQEKVRAREGLLSVDWSGVATYGPRVAVRVNAIGTPWCHRDLELVASGALPVGSVVVPKVESRGDLDFVERLLDGLEAEAARRRPPLGVQALIETAAGLAGLPAIVSRRGRLEALVIGYADLAASLSRRAGGPGEWAATRHAVLVAARSAAVEAIDGPHLRVADDETFRSEVQHAAGLGFDGKWVIHPRQVEAVVAAFTPGADEVAYADRVLAAMETAAADGRGAVQLDGRLLDEAIALAARRTLARAGR